MVVKIRLSRFGKRHQPLYNIVVSQARTARDSKPMEVLGTYDPTPRVPLASVDEEDPILNPTPNSSTGSATSAATEAEGANTTRPVPTPKKPRRYKDIELDINRTKYWLGVGAQPSEPMWRLLSMMGLIEPKPKPNLKPRRPEEVR